MKINKAVLNNIFSKSGFTKSDAQKNMFYANKTGDIRQIFLPSLIKKMGSVRLDGYIGLYFLEFEKKWKNSGEINLFSDLTFPLLGISISNFIDLSYNEVFHYTTHESDLETSSKYIYKKCRALPSTTIEFKNCVEIGKILDRRISDYINIYNEYYLDNPRLIKLANFLRWLERRYDFFSEFEDKILNSHQISVIKAIPEAYYFVKV